MSGETPHGRGRETLDQILHRHALTHPAKLAVADFGDRAAWTTGAARLLSWQQLDRRVETFAAFFHMLGLSPETVIAVQMPPTTDAVIVLLALSRAGLVAAPMPLALREADLTERLAALGAKAIVTQAEVLSEMVGERLRDVAAELFNIRFVFCAGDRVPDGLVELERVFAEAGDLGEMPAIERRGEAADATASLAWVLARHEGATRPAVLPRTHRHWIAAGLMTGIEAGIGPDAVIVSPFALSGLKGIGVGLVPWLVSGATLALGLPETVDRLVEEATVHAATHILVPAALARHLADRMARTGVSATLVAVSEGDTRDMAPPRGIARVDVAVLGEYGIVARRADDGPDDGLPLGEVRAPSGAAGGPVLIETRLIAREERRRASGGGPDGPATGELAVRGAMVPDQPWAGGAARHRTAAVGATEDGYMPTGMMAELVPGPSDRVMLAGPAEDRAGAGPTEVDMDEMDRLLLTVGSLDDAAAIPLVRDGLTRIGAAVVPRAGVVFDADGYLAALAAMRIGHHRVPEQVFVVPAIARGLSGRPMRAGMAARLTAEA